DAFSRHHAEARLAIGNVPRELHFKDPFRATGSPAGNPIIPMPGANSCAVITGLTRQSILLRKEHLCEERWTRGSSPGVTPREDQTMANHVPRHELRNMLVPGAALLLPGVANALAARVVADQGFAAAYV